MAGIDFVPDEAFLDALTARLLQLIPSMPADALARTARALTSLGTDLPGMGLVVVTAPNGPRHAAGTVSASEPQQQQQQQEDVPAQPVVQRCGGRRPKGKGLVGAALTDEAAGDGDPAALPTGAGGAALAPTPLLQALLVRARQVFPELGPLGLPVVLQAVAFFTGSVPPVSGPSSTNTWGDGSTAGSFSGSQGVATGASTAATAAAAASASASAVLPLGWCDAAVAATLPLLPLCPPDRLASLGWSLAALRHKPPPSWLHEWLVCCRARLRAMDARDLATVAWAAACLQHRPGATWLEDYCREAGRRLAFFDAQVRPLGSTGMASSC